MDAKTSCYFILSGIDDRVRHGAGANPLDERKIPLAGFALHRPTLDDVFMSLTGHAAENDQEAEPAVKRRRRSAARSS